TRRPWRTISAFFSSGSPFVRCCPFDRPLVPATTRNPRRAAPAGCRSFGIDGEGFTSSGGKSGLARPRVASSEFFSATHWLAAHGLTSIPHRTQCTGEWCNRRARGTLNPQDQVRILAPQLLQSCCTLRVFRPRHEQCSACPAPILRKAKPLNRVYP